VCLDIHGIDAIARNGALVDEDGHGTHVAGTIAAKGGNDRGIVGAIGDNNNVKIMGCRFMGPRSSWLSDAIVCMEYALSNGADITANSWGWEGSSSRAFESMLIKAHYADQLFVAAAGNGARSIDNANSAHWPASYPYGVVLSVANSDQRDRLRASSNFGIYSVDMYAHSSQPLDIIVEYA
jgi:subtilisin family serine protease